MRKYGGEVIYRIESDFGPVEVVEDPDTRSLHFGEATRQSAMLLLHPVVLVLAYTRYMLAALLFRDAPRRVLLIGLGGGSLVRFLEHHYPGCRIEVVEPSPLVTTLARRYFELPEGPDLEILETDLMGFVASDPGIRGSYDLVLVDAFDRVGMVPEVAERHVIASLAERLAPDGVLAVNLSRREQGLHQRALASLGAAFPGRLLRLPVIDKGNEVALGLAARGPLPGGKALAARAEALHERLGLEFPLFTRLLQRGEPGLLRRLLPGRKGRGSGAR